MQKTNSGVDTETLIAMINGDRFVAANIGEIVSLITSFDNGDKNPTNIGSFITIIKILINTFHK